MKALEHHEQSARWPGCYAVNWDYGQASRIWPEAMFYSESPLGTVPVSLCTQRDWKQVPVPFILASRKGRIKVMHQHKRTKHRKHIRNKIFGPHCLVHIARIVCCCLSTLPEGGNLVGVVLLRVGVELFHLLTNHQAAHKKTIFQIFLIFVF